MRNASKGALVVSVLSIVIACGSSSAGPQSTSGSVGVPDGGDGGGSSGGADDGGPGLDGTSSTDAADDADAKPDTRKEPPIVHPISGVTVETFAGSSVAGGAEGTGTVAQFSNPVGIAINAAGELIITEYDANRVRKLSAGAVSSTVATGLLQPFGVTTIADTIYVQTDEDQAGTKSPTSGTIWKIPAGGAAQVVVTGLGRPRGLVRLGDGRIVLSDRLRNTVSVLDPASKAVTALAGSGTAGFADGTASAAQFDNPYGGAVLPDGSVVIADSGNNCLRRITLAGVVTLFAGDRNPGMKDDADKMKARFDGPRDVAADAAGNVYVADNHRVRRVSVAGAVETVAGDGTRGFADGAGNVAQFYAEEQLDVAADGKTIFVADGNGGDPVPFNRIRRVTLP